MCRRTTAWFAISILFATAFVRADDIVGVQPAALDQPRIYLNLRRPTEPNPLAAKADGGSSSAIEAFLDTGASGVVISDQTFSALGIHKSQLQGKDIEYEETGVGGAEEFFVSEPLLFSIAEYSSNTEGDNPGAYSKPAGPIRCELRRGGDMLEMLMGGLDVAGMPVMAGKVAVIDPKPLNTFTDKLRTSILSADDSTIPKVTRHIPLTYVPFARFSRCTVGAEPPAVLPNPMIGPNPFKKDDHSAPVTARLGEKTISMTMLLDSGAVCSMISEAQAKKLGVEYSADRKHLHHIADKDLFTLTVGGIGGNKAALGFFLDRLILPTKNGEPAVSYGKAPVLVNDISVVDPKTHEQFTLDGVFGMNFLVASANVTGGLVPDIGNMTEGPFSMIVIDHARGFLGVTPRN